MTRIYLILPEESKAHLGIIWHEKYCFLNLEVKFADKGFLLFIHFGLFKIIFGTVCKVKK